MEINEIEEYIINLIKTNPNMADYNLRDIDKNTDLIEYGVNSISFISLMLEVEKKYNIEFEDEYLNPSNFKNINAIAEYINKLLNE